MSVEKIAKTAEKFAEKTDDVERQKREISRDVSWLKKHPTEFAAYDLQKDAQKLASLEREKQSLESEFKKLN